MSGKGESNPRHSAWEADVLPLNYSRMTKKMVASFRNPVNKKYFYFVLIITIYVVL